MQPTVHSPRWSVTNAASDAPAQWGAGAHHGGPWGVGARHHGPSLVTLVAPNLRRTARRHPDVLRAVVALLAALHDAVPAGRAHVALRVRDRHDHLPATAVLDSSAPSTPIQSRQTKSLRCGKRGGRAAASGRGGAGPGPRWGPSARTRGRGRRRPPAPPPRSAAAPGARRTCQGGREVGPLSSDTRGSGGCRRAEGGRGGGGGRTQLSQNKGLGRAREQHTVAQKTRREPLCERPKGGPSAPRRRPPRGPASIQTGSAPLGDAPAARATARPPDRL
jgi:hypothetical protein